MTSQWKRRWAKMTPTKSQCRSKFRKAKGKSFIVRYVLSQFSLTVDVFISRISDVKFCLVLERLEP